MIKQCNISPKAFYFDHPLAESSKDPLLETGESGRLWSQNGTSRIEREGRLADAPHLELGWLLVDGDTTQSLWIWSQDLGWLWTGKTSYPFLFSADQGDWLWYKVGSSSPRVFYDFADSMWETKS